MTLTRFNEADIREVARTEIERKFMPGEPLFILRGQDRRALGAVRWYRDHQWPKPRRSTLTRSMTRWLCLRSTARSAR